MDIVRYNEQIQHKDEQYRVWRYGVILEDGKGSMALVREENRSISVSVKGKGKTLFLSELRDTLNDIFNSYKSDSPELKYRITRHGEIPNNLPTKKDLYLSEGSIQRHLRDNNRPYYDDETGLEIPLQPIAKKYNLTQNIFHINAPIEKLVVGKSNHNENNFNFHNCTLEIQGSLNDLSRRLKKEGKDELAEDIEDAVEILDEIGTEEDKEKIKKRGYLKRLQEIVEDLGDEDSKLGKTLKGMKRGVSIAQDLAEKYNSIAQWIGYPQVPKPFLKKKE